MAHLLAPISAEFLRDSIVAVSKELDVPPEELTFKILLVNLTPERTCQPTWQVLFYHVGWISTKFFSPEMLGRLCKSVVDGVPVDLEGESANCGCHVSVSFDELDALFGGTPLVDLERMVDNLLPAAMEDD